MKKDLSLALLLGGIVGGILTFSLYKVTNLALKRVKNAAVQDQIKNETPTPTVNQPDEIKIPTSFSTNKTTVEITGESKANSLLVITSNNKDYPTTTDANGQFKQIITLQPGMNTFLATLLIPDKPVSKNVYLFYSPKIANEIDNYPLKMGYVIDIAETSFQINTYATKNGNASEILLSTTDENTVFEKQKSDALVTTSKSELAIGDFVVITDNRVTIIPKPADDLSTPQLTTMTKTILVNKKLVIFPVGSKLEVDDVAWLISNRTAIVPN